MLSSHKDKLGRALPGGTRAAQRLALRSSLREDGSSTLHQTEPAGPHRASSEPTDTGDTLQGPSIPTTSCCEALCQLPFIPGQLSSTPGRHPSAPATLEPGFTQLWHTALCKGSWFCISRRCQLHHPSSRLLSAASSQARVLRAGPSLPDTGIKYKKTALGKAGLPATSSPFLEKTEFGVRRAEVFNTESL